MFSPRRPISSSRCSSSPASRVGAIGLDCLQDRLGKAQELLVLRHGLGLAADCDERADVAGDRGQHFAFGGLPPRLLAGCGHALLAQEPLGRLDVSPGLLERALGRHHPRAGQVAELLDEPCGDLHLAHCASWGTASASGSGSGCGLRRCFRLGRRAPAPARGCLRRLCLRRGFLDRRREVGRGGLRLAGRDPVRDGADDQPARANGVVVARDHEVGLVGVAVRVHERDHGQAEPPRLAYGQLLLAQVDDEDRVGLLAHVGDAAEVRLELLQIALQRDPLLRREQRELPFVAQATELVQVLDPLGDRAPVREQAAEPAVVDVRHPDALGVLLDAVLGLLLRADEEHGAAALGEVAHERLGLLQALRGLLQVDDVDAAALAEDEALHLRVPAARLVAEMDAGLQELSHADGQGGSFLSVCVVLRWSRVEPALTAPAPPPANSAG